MEVGHELDLNSPDAASTATTTTVTKTTATTAAAGDITRLATPKRLHPKTLN